jgi:arginase
MGLGPQVLLAEETLPRRLETLGLPYTIEWIEADDPEDEGELLFMDQMSRYKLQNQRLAARVRDASQHGDLPIVMAGNCSSSIGVLAGIGTEDCGVVWFDAHADFDTPESTVTGLFEGMALATVTGQCWGRWRSGIPGSREVSTDRVVLVGLHGSLDCGVERLDGSGIRAIGPEAREAGYAESLRAALDGLAHEVRGVYLHLDLDVLDPSVARASRYVDPGGLDRDELLTGIEMVSDRFWIPAVTVSAYDPEIDDRMRPIATEVASAAAVAALNSQATG